MSGTELDLRPLRQQDKPGAALAAYRELDKDSVLVLTDEREPEGLREAFAVEHPESHSWDAVDGTPWRTHIRKLASTPLPRVLCDTADGTDDPEASGALWKLPMHERDLDSNIIQLPARAGIDAHTGPDIDVLMHVLDGTGRLLTERTTIELYPGALLWLPRHSQRRFIAGINGLRYLTVHRKRQALTIGMR